MEKRLGLMAVLAVLAMIAGVGAVRYMAAEDRARRAINDEMDALALRQAEMAEAH